MIAQTLDRVARLKLRTRILLLAAMGGLPVAPLAWALAHPGANAGQAFAWAAALSLLTFGVIWYAIGRLLAPLRELQTAMRRAAEEGDLTQPAQVSSQDEVGELAGLFNGLLELLRQVNVSMGRSVEQLATSVTALRTASQEQSASAARQAANLHQTQVTAEEIRLICISTDARAAEVLLSSAKAAKLGQGGQKALGRGQAELGAIAARVREMREQVGALPPHMRHIEGVLNTVKDLADQSNMLALNASIEAVRSGEHGKGFALVAREIRSLADASLRSTQRIRETLDNLKDAVAQTDRLAGQGTEQVEKGLEEVRSSSATLGQLAPLVQADADAAQQIVEAVRQQTKGVEQIFLALRDQDQMMEETHRQSQALADAVSPLEGMATRMQRLVQRFVV